MVDSAVIHDDDRVWPRKWIHMIQETSYEIFEQLRVERSFDNLHGKDTIQRESGKNGKPVRNAERQVIGQKYQTDLFPRIKTDFLFARSPHNERP